MNDNFHHIKEFEDEYHNDLYQHHELFTPGSWLVNPVKEVLDACSLLEIAPDRDINILDLGCGVGRHGIAIAKKIKTERLRIFCIDYLPIAIAKLKEYSRIHKVDYSILPILCDIDDFIIKPEYYHFIMSVACIEHLPTKDKFDNYIHRIQQGTAVNGLNFLMINADNEWFDKKTGKTIKPLVPFNLSTDITINFLEDAYKDWDIVKFDVAKHSSHRKYKKQSIVCNSCAIYMLAIKKKSDAKNS